VVESLSNTFDPKLGVFSAPIGARTSRSGCRSRTPATTPTPKCDRLLEAAATEPDEKKRREHLVSSSSIIIHNEVASVDLVAAGAQIVANKRVKNYVTGSQGLNWSFGDLWIDPSA
jgi:peptide/nickel transport system substrate-binding protein